jgi:hypothetical protein
MSLTSLHLCQGLIVGSLFERPLAVLFSEVL